MRHHFPGTADPAASDAGPSRGSTAAPEARVKFRVASEPAEFEQIFRLNHATFAHEIPQHAPRADGRLVDRFHGENTYLIALEGDELVGMMAVRDRRPFSLDQKLPDLDKHLPPGRPLEVRLLSVVPRHRKAGVLPGLLRLLYERFGAMGYDVAVISGTVRQQRLYNHLGFVPFGPLVGTSEAAFQPMYVTLEGFKRSAAAVLAPPARTRQLTGCTLRFTTGPVATKPAVLAALSTPPEPHRGPECRARLRRVRRRLCELVNGRDVQLFIGTGTLANDMVAAQLALLGEPGLVLCNGEFGRRLIDHARGFGLTFDALERAPGEAFDADEVRAALDRLPGGRWLWVVGCETSTGVLNDLAVLKELCGSRGVRLCVDAVSLIGTVPVDLDGVYLASCVSGKGLASAPGLAMVFHHELDAPRSTTLPRYLDLSLYTAQDGMPFTHASNQLAALETALEDHVSGTAIRAVAERSAWLRPRLRELGFKILAPDAHASPAVITIPLPPPLLSEQLGRRLSRAGILIGYASEYLIRSNWIQIGLMGDCSRKDLAALLDVMAHHALCS